MVKDANLNVVIVEGILIFNNEELRNLFDIKVFVHADSDERLIRRIRRDIAERGRDIDEVLERYQNTLKPAGFQIGSVFRVEAKDSTFELLIRLARAAKTF